MLHKRKQYHAAAGETLTSESPKYISGTFVANFASNKDTRESFSIYAVWEKRQ